LATDSAGANNIDLLKISKEKNISYSPPILCRHFSTILIIDSFNSLYKL